MSEGQRGFAFSFACDACGGVHKLLVDDSGHHSGRLPCRSERRIELQLDPQRWREIVETYKESAVH